MLENSIYSIWIQCYNDDNLTLSLTSPGFYVFAVQVFLKTLWEKQKLLITSNFSFSHTVFYPFWRTFRHFHRIWDCRLQALSVWEGLKFIVWEKVKKKNVHFSEIIKFPESACKCKLFVCLVIFLWWYAEYKKVWVAAWKVSIQIWLHNFLHFGFALCYKIFNVSKVYPIILQENQTARI